MEPISALKPRCSWRPTSSGAISSRPNYKHVVLGLIFTALAFGSGKLTEEVLVHAAKNVGGGRSRLVHGDAYTQGTGAKK
jgi:hypothetical protein